MAFMEVSTLTIWSDSFDEEVIIFCAVFLLWNILVKWRISVLFLVRRIWKRRLVDDGGWRGHADDDEC
jgi:hypothetical protein